MTLADYASKRDFRKTTEPKFSRAKSRGNRFVIQKHAATRLHYDFRLEIGGVLKSWAVPEGIPFSKGQKSLAVQVEDHPLDYADFEGTIPKGQYGGGTVMVWDKGNFSTNSKSPTQELENGKLHFTLDGKKLHGDWHLVQLRGGSNWLLIKGGENLKPVSKKSDDTSALSGKTMKQLSKNGAVWESNRGAHAPRVHPTAPSRSEKRAPSRVETGAVARSSQLTGRQLLHARRARSPIQSIEPMKAKLAESPPTHGDWIYEIKFDGFRALAFKNGGDVRLFSRNEKNFGGKFPEIVEAISKLKIEEAIIDGEIVALDKKGVSSFQLLQAFEIGEERPPIYFYAFDLLRLNGKDLSQQSLVERKTQLEKILKGGASVPTSRSVEHFRLAGTLVPPKNIDLIRFSASLGEDVEKLLKRVEKLGLEGLIGKRKDSTYEAGKRSGAWIKLKLQRAQEFVIGGYTNPEGTRQHFGALLVGFYENGKLKFCGKVGTGFDTKLLAGLHSQFQKISRDDCPFVNLPELRGSRYSPRITPGEMKKCHWIEPNLVCQIRFSEWTRDEKLRQPVFLGLREDKNAGEVVREKTR